MFHFPAYPPETRFRCQPMTTGGLPHSDTLGSKPCRRLPQDYRGPTRPSSVLSAKASTIRPSRQPQQIIMTKALLKNPRTTSDHETHHNSVLPNDTNEPRDHTAPRIRITVRTPTPPTTGGPMLASTIQFSNHHPTRTPTRTNRHRATDLGDNRRPHPHTQGPVAAREPNSTHHTTNQS